eukprot:COSAG05_NODE_2831_length_2591_cov_1.839486_3_plen_89_part_00
MVQQLSSAPASTATSAPAAAAAAPAAAAVVAAPAHQQSPERTATVEATQQPSEGLRKSGALPQRLPIPTQRTRTHVSPTCTGALVNNP